MEWTSGDTGSRAVASNAKKWRQYMERFARIGGEMARSLTSTKNTELTARLLRQSLEEVGAAQAIHCNTAFKVCFAKRASLRVQA